MLHGSMRKLIYVLLPLVFAASCEKLTMPKNNKKHTVVFEELWQTIDKGYSLFAYKKLDPPWDTVHAQYKRLIYDTVTDRMFFDTCAKMLALLHDPQIVLDAGFAATHLDERYKAPVNFNRQLLERYYWKNYEKTGPLIHTIIDSIGYIYYGSFNDDVSDDQLKAVIDKFRDNALTKGVIIDIRGNEGGKMQNVFNVLSKIDIPDELLNTTTLIYQAAYKNGPKHDQFTKFQDNWLNESTSDKFFGNVRVLTNRTNKEAATLFASGAESFANVKVMGDTTYGYSGLQSAYELSNGLRIYYPSSLLQTSVGENMIKGVAPDTLIYMNPAHEALGKDDVLEAALADLKKQ